MRILMIVSLPNEPFNTLVRNGTAGTKIQQALGDIKPEVAYFTEHDGQRGAVLVVNVSDWSELPAKGEPLFLLFNASIRFQPAMSPEDLGKADLESLGKKGSLHPWEQVPARSGGWLPPSHRDAPYTSTAGCAGSPLRRGVRPA